MNGISRFFFVGLTIGVLGCSASPDSPAADNASAEASTSLSGPYLGQRPPGPEPQIFAPGLISTGLAERDFAMTPEGDEIYYTSVLGAGFDFSAIVTTRLIDGVWSEPAVASFSGRFKDLEPAISPDGERFYFVSYRPDDGLAEPPAGEDIFTMDRVAGGWSEPRRMGLPINTEQAEFFPSVTRDGTLYFTRRSEDRTESIYRSRWVDGSYSEVEKLGPEVNGAPTQFNAFIDPDERFLIVCSWGREDSLGGVDYYIVFRQPDDTWQGPFNLGDTINTEEGQEWSPYVSPDGQYFFFMASRHGLQERAAQEPLTYVDLERLHRDPMNGNSDIWWVDAVVLDALRPDETEGGPGS